LGQERFNEQDILLTTQEATEFLRVSRPTIGRWLASGRLVGHKVGRGWRFYKRDLHAFVSAQDGSGTRTLPAPSEKSPGSPPSSDLTLDVTTHTVTLYRTNTIVYLTPFEARLLHVLLRNAGHSMRWEGLALTIWGSDTEHLGKQLDGYIARLRNKLEEDPNDPKLIQTVPGVGYRLGSAKAPPPARRAETKIQALS
jgi:excisionase family DNA binding protein